MATDTARQKADQAKEEGRHLGEEARSRGEQVGREAKQEMGRVLDDARSRARQQADDQTHRAAGALRGMADQLNTMAESTDEQGVMVDMAQNGAQRIRRFADQIEEGGIDGMVGDVQNFARRRPGTFIATGMGIGIALGRVFRASDMNAMKEAVTPQGQGDQPAGRGSSEQGQRPDELRRRSEPLTPEDPPQPANRREGPEAGRSI